MLESDPYRLGFGTYSLTGEDGVDTIVTALNAGYRHLDTARLYGNEDVVGEAIDRVDIDRDELFVATKIAHFEEPEKTAEYVRKGVTESFERLNAGKIDLLYHHWPRREEDVKTVLPVFDKLIEDGIVERVGVSNYTTDYLDLADDLLDASLYANQVEMHPLLPQHNLHTTVRERGAFLVAYSPIAQGKVFDVPELSAVAEKHDVNEATVSLAWLLSKEGVVPIPRSKNPAHIRSNHAALKLSLDEEDINRIDRVDRGHRCEDPSWMEWD